MCGAGDSPAMSEGQTTTAGRMISGTMYDNMALQGMYFRQVCLHFYYKKLCYIAMQLLENIFVCQHTDLYLFVPSQSECVGIQVDYKTFHISDTLIKRN